MKQVLQWEDVKAAPKSSKAFYLRWSLGLLALLAGLAAGTALQTVSTAQETPASTMLDGAVVVRSDGRAFLIQGGQKREIPVVKLTDLEIDQLPTGSAVASGGLPSLREPALPCSRPRGAGQLQEYCRRLVGQVPSGG